MNFSTADVVWILVWIAIYKLLAIWRLVHNAIVIGAVNWRGRFGKQNWNVTVAAATLALFFRIQINAVAVA
jgi:hypothetical protein